MIWGSTSNKITEITQEIEDSFIEFQDTLIKIKAAIAIFKANKASLWNYESKIKQIEVVEKDLDSHISQILSYANVSLRPDSYQLYSSIKNQMNSVNKYVQVIQNLCKDALFNIFNDRLFEALNEICGNGVEEYKYSYESTIVHPIFGKKLTLFTMVCQGEQKINQINDELSRKFKVADKLEEVSILK